MYVALEITFSLWIHDYLLSLLATYDGAAGGHVVLSGTIVSDTVKL